MAFICPNCGRDYPVRPKFCGTCGTFFGEEDVSGSNSSPYSEFSTPPERDTSPIPPRKKASATSHKTTASFDDGVVDGIISVRNDDSPNDEKWSSVNRMPEGIALGTDEKVVKKYNIGRYTFRQGAIDVVVTNKRVIRYEDSVWFGMRTNRIDEINIDAVHGMSCVMARSVSILGLIATLVFLIAGISILSETGGYRYYGFLARLQQLSGWAIIALAVFIAFKSIRPTLFFCLHGSVGGPALETSVNAAGRLFGRNNASVVFQFKPTAETTLMLKEIGALIYDLKVLGDKAIEKW